MSTVGEDEPIQNNTQEVAWNEDFFVLKFPQKLWRIVNECSSGAIQWGTYGKTILIDYNRFQSQYLECETPKFKTRNMTSFVRQLNMYGFKKMQTQLKNDSYRCCNIHEFFHNYFRFGRYDLLDEVKRRPTPAKGLRSIQPLVYNSQSRLQRCRAAFTKALERSAQYQYKQTREEISEPPESYRYQVIPVENSLKDYMLSNDNHKKLTLEISSDFQAYINMDPSGQDEEEEEDDGMENEEVEMIDYEEQEEEGEFAETREAFKYLEEAALNDDGQLDLSVNKYSTLGSNQLVQVTKKFDGSNFVIDFQVECPGGQDMAYASHDLGAEDYEQEAADTQAGQDQACIVYIPEDEEGNFSNVNFGQKTVHVNYVQDGTQNYIQQDNNLDTSNNSFVNEEEADASQQYENNTDSFIGNVDHVPKAETAQEFYDSITSSYLRI